MTSYVVMNCPLAGINGVHTDHQGNKEFIHSTGMFKLVLDFQWSIKECHNPNTHAIANKLNSNPCGLKWRYYSMKHMVWKDSKHMSVIQSDHQESHPKTGRNTMKALRSRTLIVENLCRWQESFVISRISGCLLAYSRERHQLRYGLCDPKRPRCHAAVILRRAPCTSTGRVNPVRSDIFRADDGGHAPGGGTFPPHAGCRRDPNSRGHRRSCSTRRDGPFGTIRPANSCRGRTADTQSPRGGGTASEPP